MIYFNDTICPICGGKLRYYETIKRHIKIYNGVKKLIYMRIFRCTVCLKYHRELPDDIIPFKQYTKRVIIESIETRVSDEYPCEMTIKRWKKLYK